MKRKSKKRKRQTIAKLASDAVYRTALNEIASMSPMERYIFEKGFITGYRAAMRRKRRGGE